MVTRIILAVGLLLVLGCQAREEKKLAEPEPGKTPESATPAPTTERREVSASSESAAGGSSREGAPVGGSK